MTLKVFDPRHIKLIWSLIKGEINFATYLRRRGLSETGKFEDLKFFVNDNHYMINEFLSMISVGLRCRAMKGLFSLTDRDIEKFIDFGKSSLGYFIRENMKLNKDSEIVSQRKTSLELIYDLAIIFDLPFRYLADTYTKYEMIYSFIEYNTPKIKVKNLHNLIEEIILEMNNGDKTKRKRDIFGVKVVNDYFEAGEKKYLYTRVDVREDFFTIEIHLENEANVNTPELLKLEKSIGIKHEIYIRNAFLRDNKKLYILIPVVEELQHNVIYLPQEFLWRNVLNGLNTKVMEEIKRIEDEESKVNFD